MNKFKQYFLLSLLVFLPLVAFGQNGYIPWPAHEDTIIVPPGTTLNTFIFQDTAGTQWQGTNATTYWQNKTRVYVLKANQTYNWASTCTLNVANRKLMIRGESGKNYQIPNLTGDYRPKIIGVGTTLPGGIILNQLNDTLILKNVAFCGYDELGAPTNVDNVNTNLMQTSATGSGSIYVDSCVLEGFTTGMAFNGRVYTARIQNSIFGDAGTMMKSNLGAGRIVDGRDVECDTLDFSNNTVFNVIDRVVRRLTAKQPIHNFMMNHNTILNCMSYHGFVSLGWVDSTGAGTFNITNNLFVDNFALGADTDYTRQGEFTDNPDNDPNNGLSKMAWFVARRNPTTNKIPWVISNNFYAISDSGKAIRNFVTPLHPVLYAPITSPEPILTSDLQTQLTNNGGNPSTAFKLITNIKFANAPQTIEKICKWYFSPSVAGYIPTTLRVDSCIGAGAGKIKNTAKPVLNFAGPLSQFTLSSNQFNRWPYDYRRMRIDSVMDWLDCSFDANWNLASASSDGKIVGATMWKFVDLGLTTTGVKSLNQIPGIFALEQNYPNPFNPTTSFTYQVGSAGFVSVRIYDLLGREVATLVNEVKQAGSYPVTWNAAAFGSGVYFCKMQSGSFVATKKMILIK